MKVRRALTVLLVTASFALAQSAEDRRAWPRTDFARHSVDPAEIESGGPPRDGIPAIDHPRFVSIESARHWLKEREPVIVLRIGEDVRAYPLQILIYHEIVNDTVDSVPVVVTFCPLCNAAIVFERRIDGRELDFGTTGRLRMSDLVMYDRQTESWWQQFTGQGIVGRHAGGKLREIPAEIAGFGEFARSYPGGKVLSRETGFDRSYGHNPYTGYDRVDQSPFLFRGRLDTRLPPMERVLAIEAGGRIKVYALSALRSRSTVEGRLEDVPYAIFIRGDVASALDTERIEKGRPVPAAAAYDRRVDGRTLSFSLRDGAWVDGQTGSRWNAFGEAVAGPLAGRHLKSVSRGVHFAFAWLAFRPESEVVRAP